LGQFLLLIDEQEIIKPNDQKVGAGEEPRAQMKHYSSEQWADYLREAAPKGTMAEMKRHLESGCKKCEQTADMWTTVLKLAHKEAGYQPPDNAVRMAKSYFAMCQMEEKKALVPRIASLVFDSLRQPRLAGVRSSGSVPQHYVYRAGQLLVDIWMEPAKEAFPATLTGQILDVTSPSKGAKEIMVTLKSDRAEISATTTNQFGEFNLDLGKHPGRAFHLTIYSNNTTSIIIPLRLIEPVQAEA